MFIFNPFPVIDTKNLILRKIEYKDINDLFEMRKNLSMHVYTDTKPDETSDETRAYIEKMIRGIDENKWIIWAMQHRQSTKVIGSISIWNINMDQNSGELGYGIVPDYQGKGLMKEALTEVIRFGFEVMNLKALEAYTEENNISSRKLLEGCRFLEIGTVADEGFYNNRIYNMIVYRLENNCIVNEKEKLIY